jgi:hypothetical protein
MGLALFDGANEAAGKRPKTRIDATVQRVKRVARWLGSRRWVRIGEGRFGRCAPGFDRYRPCGAPGDLDRAVTPGWAAV